MIRAYRPNSRLWSVTVFLLLTCLVAIAACNVQERGSTVQETSTAQGFELAETPHLSGEPLVESLSTAPASIATQSIVPDTGWKEIEAGLERRVLNLIDAEGGLLESLFLLRLEPARFQFDVAYSPGNPKSLGEWLEITGALIVVNGGFFTEEYSATGLVISGGEESGTSFQGFGGMVAITEQGPEIRWLPSQPYARGEPLKAALQSFPMLIWPGNEPGYGNDDGSPARRTVIGRDARGRIVFIVAAIGAFTLDALSRYLTESDLELDRALNLDGGASSGLLLASPADGVGAFSLLPVVLTVHRRGSAN